MADVKHCTASPINYFEGFLHIFYCWIKILRNHWLRNYFIKLVDRGKCKIIGTRLTMFHHRIVEFLHKRNRRICSLLAFGEFLSGGFFHWVMVFNATFNNISVISWQSVLLMEETWVCGDNHGSEEVTNKFYPVKNLKDNRERKHWTGSLPTKSHRLIHLILIDFFKGFTQNLFKASCHI